ncbi:MAG: YkgJ family cysteine cluster protein [Desulfatiglandales bacterium]
MSQGEKALSGESGKTCKRCGNCCRTYLFAYTSDEDIKRWRHEGREDILHVLEKASPIWAGDHIISARTGETLYTCPFLVWDGQIATCTIHDTRPRVCREYIPGSNELCSQFAGRASKKD